jgi:GNAT superfamily N-acetyltransferase
MAPVELVPASPADAAFVAAVARDAVPLYAPLLPGAFERFAAKVEREGLPGAYRVSLIRRDGTPVGFAGVDDTLPNGVVYLAALYLARAERRRGTGGAALEAIVGAAAKAGAREVALLVHRDAAWAGSFYEARGFRFVTADPGELRAYAGGVLARHALPETIPVRLLSRNLVPTR